MTTGTRARLVVAYFRHRQGLYSLALSITHCKYLAEDVLQEAFARVWTREDVDVKGVPAYLFAAVRNAAIDQVRKRRPLDSSLMPADSMYDVTLEDPAQEAAEAELRRLAAKIVEGLPDEEREVIVMRVHGGLSFLQISEALGMPVSTVAHHYHRTLAKIRSQLEGGSG